MKESFMKMSEVDFESVESAGPDEVIIRLKLSSSIKETINQMAAQQSSTFFDVVRDCITVGLVESNVLEEISENKEALDKAISGAIDHFPETSAAILANNSINDFLSNFREMSRETWLALPRSRRVRILKCLKSILVLAALGKEPSVDMEEEFFVVFLDA